MDPSDPRSVTVNVAGPAALLVAKLHQINERAGGERAVDKDAVDVWRLLRGFETEALATRWRGALTDPRCDRAARKGLDLLLALFKRGGAGTEMAVRATSGLMTAAEVRRSCEILSLALHSAVCGALGPDAADPNTANE